MLARPSQLVHDVLGAAIDVHRALGPGLLESSYRACLCYELSERRIPIAVEVPVKLAYKGVHIDCSYRADLIVANAVPIEVKSVERFVPLHDAQVMTYLKLLDLHQGLLLNFNARTMKEGIRNILR